MKTKVYFFNDLEPFSHENFLPLLCAKRREKALAYKKIIDQKLCVAAFLLLRIALRDVSFFDEPVLDVQAKGKPIILEPQGFHFNLSHCTKGAVCAFGKRPLGVDIQDPRPTSQNLIKKTMGDKEIDFILNSPDSDRAFAYLWSRKESMVKQSGEGISRPLTTLNSLEFHETDTFEGEDFFISLSGGKIDLVKVEIADFSSLLSQNY